MWNNHVTAHWLFRFESCMMGRPLKRNVFSFRIKLTLILMDYYLDDWEFSPVHYILHIFTEIVEVWHYNAPYCKNCTIKQQFHKFSLLTYSYSSSANEENIFYIENKNCYRSAYMFFHLLAAFHSVLQGRKLSLGHYTLSHSAGWGGEWSSYPRQLSSPKLDLELWNIKMFIIK